MVDAMTDPRPDVFSYLDHRAFLGDWFAWRKRVNPRFSHRLFARLAGVKSPSLLSEVVKGRRNLTATTTASFARAMSLDPEEAAFFAMLVDLDRARNDDERNGVWERISAARRFQTARRIDGEAFRYLSRWYLPAIRELATSPHFRPEPSWIARHLRPPITPEQAADALDTLQALGMLVPDADGRLHVADVTVVTPHEVAGLAVHNYHRGMLRRATESIELFRPAERHLGGVTVAIPAALLPRLKEELTRFQEHMLDLCDSAEGERQRVIQIGLQLFPLSSPLDEDP
ncbi:MAG: TIGR02147 family protein [Deltaproteobacteria bacterium]|nr:MAG: TIGR02147 family protein [Deltaproteobacteria bacterium]